MVTFSQGKLPAVQEGVHLATKLILLCSFGISSLVLTQSVSLACLVGGRNGEIGVAYEGLLDYVGQR